MMHTGSDANTTKSPCTHMHSRNDCLCDRKSVQSQRVVNISRCYVQAREGAGSKSSITRSIRQSALAIHRMSIVAMVVDLAAFQPHAS